MDRAAAQRALALVSGLDEGNAAAEGLIVDAFDSHEEAAAAFAHLAGFAIQVLAAERREPTLTTIDRLRALLA